MPELPTGNDQQETSVQSIPVPPTPQTGKSSNEILCELFGAFNATPPPLDDLTPQDSQSAASERSNKKHKKHSKKKSKKVKKKKRSSSSDSKSSHEVKKKQLCKRHKKESGKQSISESESVDSKKKKKKRKLGKFSASDTDSDEGESKSKKKKSDKEEKPSKRDKVKIKQEKEDDKGIKLKDSKSSTDNNSTQENILKHNVGKIVDKVIDSTNLATEISKSIISVKIESNLSEETAQLPLPIKQEPENVAPEEKIPKDVDERQNPTKMNSLGIEEPGKHPTVADVFAEDLIDCGIKKDEFKTAPEKSKPTTKKIMIQNLKFSQVYEATVKQIEEEAKLKAEKYEEGELSESTAEEERSPTPSEVSSSGSVEEVELETPSEEKKRHRHHHKKQSHRHGSRRSSSKEKHRSHSHRERSPSQQSHSCRHRRQRKSRERGSRRVEERNRDQDSKEKVRNKDRDRSKDKGRNRDRERSKDREKARGKSKDRMRGDKHRHGHGSRSRSREREKRSPDEKIDKQKLLEIARKNALNMMKNPSGAPEQTKLAITSGGKTVNELTDFCKLLSKKDADGHESISSNTSHSSDSESEKPFHHPFQIKDRPSSIVLNIRNAVALPVKSLQEKTAEQSRQLRLQFPVSSGQHHRKTESEWIPVSPKKTEATTIPTNTQVAIIKPVSKPSRVFKDTPDPPKNMDIGSIVSQRLNAMRRLQENPTDTDALTEMYAAQQNMQSWAESKQQPPGQFTGSTGVRVLSQAELASGYQAWARRDQLQAAAPVNSGMGMTLLQKMGWRPGEGLGKNKEGTLQPLLLEVKMDKKGLVAQEELPVRQPNQILRGPPRSVEGKHPVSLLNEFCSWRKYGPPYFELIDEAGPDHKKNFLFKVRVNGVEYKPAVGSPKKKQARAEAAEVCLKALNILPNN